MQNFSASDYKQQKKNNGNKAHNLLGRFFLSASERRHKFAAFRRLLRSVPCWRVANGDRYCVFSHLVTIHLQHSLCRGRLFTCKYLLHSGMGVKYCDPCVCLSVCWHVSKTMRPNFTIIFCMLPVARSSSDGNAICTSSFVDDVMFSYNRRNKLESKKTRMFHPFCQVAALGAKCAISNCILLTLNSCMSRGSSGRGTGHRQLDAQLFGRHAANQDKSFTNCSHPVQIVSSDTLKLGR